MVAQDVHKGLAVDTPEEQCHDTCISRWFYVSRMMVNAMVLGRPEQGTVRNDINV